MFRGIGVNGWPALIAVLTTTAGEALTDFIWDLGTGISKSLSIAHQIHVHVACPVVASMPVAMPSDGLRGVQAGKGAAAAVESMKRGKGDGMAKGWLAKARRGLGGWNHVNHQQVSFELVASPCS